MAGMSASLQSNAAMEQEPEGGLEVLEADLAELENSVFHLVRSNVELAQFLDDEPGDKDLEEALEENKLALVKKRHRVKTLRNAIADLKTYRPHLANTTATRTESVNRMASSGVGIGVGGGDGGVNTYGGGDRPVAASRDGGGAVDSSISASPIVAMSTTGVDEPASTAATPPPPAAAATPPATPPAAAAATATAAAAAEGGVSGSGSREAEQSLGVGEAEGGGHGTVDGGVDGHVEQRGILL